ncbi:MAG: VWA domain-containing protein [Acidobacteria bacterium]|nr:VWA domain-containing protein [Acidobacteriota bacterium]
MRVLLAVALAAAAPLRPAAASAGPADNTVRMDARVTDARGRPLPGLGAADFELREDGTPQSIGAVRFVRASDQPRVVGIYLDEYHLTESAAVRARGALWRFVEHDLAPGDRLAIMKPLDSLLDIRIDMGRDQARAAIEGVVGRKGNDAPADAYERQYIGNAPAAIAAARSQITLSALNALAVRLGQASGEARKTLIVVSEGVLDHFDRRRLNLPDVSTIIQSANRANVSVYLVDPGDSLPGDHQGGALDRVVPETDGRSIAGPALAAGLRSIAGDSDGYYVISYRSPGRTDNRFHAVDLRVKRAGTVVRMRPGYWADAPGDVVRAAMPAPPPRAFEPALRLSRMIRPWFGASRGADGRTRVTFVWEVVALGPGEPARAGPSEVHLTAYDRDGEPVFAGNVRPVESSALAGRDLSRRAVFEAPPGRLRVQMTIEDAADRPVDTDVRDVVVADLDAPVAIGTPEVLRLRTEREFQMLAADPDAVPVAARVFSRGERLIVRVPAYAPDGEPIITATLVSALGRTMRSLRVLPAVPGGSRQIDVPLAGLVSADYRIEVIARSAAGEARQSIGFEVIP